MYFIENLSQFLNKNSQFNKLILSIKLKYLLKIYL